MARAGSLTFPLYPRFLGNHDQIRLPLLFYFFPFFSIPFIIFALLFSLPPSRNSDQGSHSRLFPPPPYYGSCLAILSRGDFSSSLVDSRRIVLTHARRSQQLVLFFFANDSKSRHGGIRTHGPTLFSSSIRGLPLVHRGD